DFEKRQRLEGVNWRQRKLPPSALPPNGGMEMGVRKRQGKRAQLLRWLPKGKALDRQFCYWFWPRVLQRGGSRPLILLLFLRPLLVQWTLARISNRFFRSIALSVTERTSRRAVFV